MYKLLVLILMRGLWSGILYVSRKFPLEELASIDFFLSLGKASFPCLPWFVPGAPRLKGNQRLNEREGTYGFCFL